VIAMEACGGANYWGREFEKLGHEVKLIAPQLVKPFVKTNKNDFNDAEAICEAASRPSMRFVALKTQEQQDIQALHRVRERAVKNRTAIVNMIRGFLLENGIAIALGVSSVRKHVPEHLEGLALSERMKRVIRRLYEELGEWDKKISEYDLELKQIVGQNEICRRLQKLEGIGPITATALYAALSQAKPLKNGRCFAASLGLVPRQHSSGGKPRLLGISKRGDSYLRSLLVHGARSAIITARKKSDRKSRWVTEKVKTRGHNRACVALANKNARIVWALMTKGVEYKQAI